MQQKFTDDLVKSLAEEMQKDVTSTADAPVEEAKPAEKPKSLAQTKSTTKSKSKTSSKAKAKVETEAATEASSEIPMDAAAIKAYSSVIADAAEDSEPAQAVVYTKTIPDEPASSTRAVPLDVDPMGSMIRNEITSIKDASVKAAKDKADE